MFRYLDYGKLSIKTYPIKNYKDAIQEYQDGTVVKALFKMDSTEILSYSGRRKEGENTENEVDDRGDSGKRRCIDGQSIENGEDEVKNETTELEISNISSKSENLTEGNDKGTIEDNDKGTTEDNDKGTTEEECNEESN
ncbi:hypothetical protein C0J52_09040 [Blattella germanica]|nr:hypothetical protein C0J52_09040 [Blattella germanica]